MANFKPKIIKPSRVISSKLPKLKKSKCVKNYNKGIETSIILDLNILSKMREVVYTKEVEYQDSGLIDLVRILNKMPALYLTPGFAISEVEKDYLISLTDSYEMFLKKYCNGYIDAPNATKSYKNINDKPSKFVELEKGEKYLNSVAYLGILRIQIEERSTTEDPFKKYDNYLSYMIEKANMIGAIESEAAKYVFADVDSIKDKNYKVFCNKIRKNFKKGGATSKKVIANCLNAARDIMYYRATADQSNEYIDNKLQDTWLVTADEGLFNLSQSVHFVPNLEGSDSKYVNFVRNNEQKESSYWKYCDDITIENLNYRQLLRAKENDKDKLNEKDLDNLLDCISESEDELSKLINS